LNPIALALAPVILFTTLGWFAGRRGWLTPERVKRLSGIVFVGLTPPLLFRTMSTVRLDEIDFRPLAAYFAALGIIFFGTLAGSGLTRRGAVIALANTFSNTVMMGIPIVGIVHGHAGLVVLLTLVSVHGLIVLTTATIVLEVALLKELGSDSNYRDRHVGHTVLLAVRNSLLHPVPLPILAGLLFAQSGFAMPWPVDKLLQVCGWLFAPLALLLVGSALASTRVGTLWRPALAIAATKNLLHPLLVALIGWAIGLRGVPYAVMVLAAALPVGANVFLFSQRYQVAQDVVTAAVAMSAAIALVTVPAVMWALQ
jgi:malonate transporter and related proteins